MSFSCEWGRRAGRVLPERTCSYGRDRRRLRGAGRGQANVRWG
ncbi:hypothetical protein [Paraoerskovia marina]|nr:hypothetical protein [Paraoerskovia marina]